MKFFPSTDECFFVCYFSQGDLSMPRLNRYPSIILLSGVFGILALLAMALFVSVPVAQAAGTASICDQSHLISALSGGGTVTFSCSGTITLTSQIVIASNTTLDGNGQNVAISGGGTVRVFLVNSGITFNLQNITVTNGYVNSSSNGGGIANLGTLNATNVVFIGNQASQGGGLLIGPNAYATLTSTQFISNTANENRGGIACDYSTLTINGALFQNNTAQATRSARGGGGLYNHICTLNMTNVSFIGNQATNQTSSGVGGGLYNMSGTINITNTTFFSNTAKVSDGGMYNTGSSPSIINTSVVQDGCPTGSTCTGSIITADPLLGALGVYGGNGQKTIPLLPGSSAIGAAIIPFSLTDQRGMSRDNSPDIGAFESQGFTLNKIGGDNQSANISTVFLQPLQISIAPTTIRSNL
jgi:hypothetical protein